MKKLTVSLLLALSLLSIPSNADAGAIRLAGRGLAAAGKGIGKAGKSVGKVTIGAIVVAPVEGAFYVGKGAKAFGEFAWKVIY